MRISLVPFVPAMLGVGVAAIGLFGAQPGHAAVECSLVGGCAGGLADGIFTFSLVSTDFTPEAGDRLQLKDDNGIAVVSFQPAPTRAFPGANSFTFSLSAPGNTFLTAFTGALGIGTLNVGLASAEFSAPGSISATATHGLLTLVSAGPISFLPGLSTATFTQSIGTAGVSSITSIQSSLSSSPIPSNPVPGPLPILGAAMAFRMSRRMRHRIKSAA